MNQSLLVSRSLRLGTALQRHRYYRDLRVSFSTDEKEIQPEEKVSIQDFLKNIAATENIKPENFLYTREIVMPDMGEGKGRVTKWFKDEGEIVRRGDVLCDIETHDFVFGLEVDDEDPSIFWKKKVEPGVDVNDEEVICVVLHEGSKKGKPID